MMGAWLGVGERISAFSSWPRSFPAVVGFSVSAGNDAGGNPFPMQKAKVSAAVRRHGEAGGLYITVLTDPPPGAHYGEFRHAGHIILAEPAPRWLCGRRVIELTRAALFPRFQSAEFCCHLGFVTASCPGRSSVSCWQGCFAARVGHMTPMKAQGGPQRGPSDGLAYFGKLFTERRNCTGTAGLATTRPSSRESRVGTPFPSPISPRSGRELQGERCQQFGCPRRRVTARPWGS
jgi:hypothetical protein